MTHPSPFSRALLDRFAGCYTSPGGEVWVRYENAVAAVDLAQACGQHLLGMEGFVVVGDSVYPLLTRITDYSTLSDREGAYDVARALLAGPWATPFPVPDDLHDQAQEGYVIDLVVAE